MNFHSRMRAYIFELQRERSNADDEAVKATLSAVIQRLEEEADKVPDAPTTFNGWANRQTWTVSSWLANDYYTEKHLAELAREAVATYADEYDAINHLADIIEDQVKNDPPEYVAKVLHEPTMYSDLLSHSLVIVDYRGIARTYIQEYTQD